MRRNAKKRGVGWGGPRFRVAAPLLIYKKHFPFIENASHLQKMHHISNLKTPSFFVCFAASKQQSGFFSAPRKLIKFSRRRSQSFFDSHSIERLPSRLERRAQELVGRALGRKKNRSFSQHRRKSKIENRIENDELRTSREVRNERNFDPNSIFATRARETATGYEFLMNYFLKNDTKSTFQGYIPSLVRERGIPKGVMKLPGRDVEGGLSRTEFF